MKERLEYLCTIGDNWYEGYGLAPTFNNINWLIDVFPKNIPVPYAYPTVIGGVYLEWERHSISLEIDFNTKTGEYISLYDKNDETEYIFDLNTTEGWNDFILKFKSEYDTN